VVTPVGAVQIGDADLVLRLVAAVALCSLIGFERSTRDEVAGLRTHALVGLGAALFTLVSAYGFTNFATATAPQPDPTRIAAQVVSGIGFLCAGAIIRQGASVRGVTTAASLWIVAAIGMAAGAGFFVGAIAATALVLVVLVVMRHVGHRLIPTVRADFVHVDVDLVRDGRAASVLELLSTHRIRIESMRSDLAPEGEQLHFDLRLPPRANFAPVVRELSTLQDVAATRCSGVRTSASNGTKGSRGALRPEGHRRRDGLRAARSPRSIDPAVDGGSARDAARRPPARARAGR
jgi:putative Mg2+ transporter-C (MgtC) family protein